MGARRIYFKATARINGFRGGLRWANRRLIGSTFHLSGDVCGSETVLQKVEGWVVANLRLDAVETLDPRLEQAVRPYVNTPLAEERPHLLNGPALSLAGSGRQGRWSAAGVIEAGLAELRNVVGWVTPAGLTGLLYGTAELDATVTYLYDEQAADPFVFWHTGGAEPAPPPSSVPPVSELVKDLSALTTGFGWKDVSEGGGFPVLFLPPQIQPCVRQVSLHTTDGVLQEIPTYTGTGSPVPIRGQLWDRAHYRFGQRASAFSDPSVVRVLLTDGWVLLYVLSTPRSRWSNVAPTVLRESSVQLSAASRFDLPDIEQPTGADRLEGRPAPILPPAGRWFTDVPEEPQYGNAFTCYEQEPDQPGGWTVVQPEQTDPLSEVEVIQLFREAQVRARAGLVLQLSGWALTGLADHSAEPAYRPHLLQFFHDLSEQYRPLYLGVRLVGPDGLSRVCRAWDQTQEQVCRMLAAWTDLLFVDAFDLDVRRTDRKVATLRKFGYDKPIVLLFEPTDRPWVRGYKSSVKEFVRQACRDGQTVCLYGAGGTEAYRQASRLISRLEYRR